MLNGDNTIRFVTPVGFSDSVLVYFHEGKAIDVEIPIGADIKDGKNVHIRIGEIMCQALVEHSNGTHCDIIVISN